MRPAQTPQTGETVNINADDVARMATANNPDLVAGGYEPRISAERLAAGARRVPADADERLPAQRAAGAAEQHLPRHQRRAHRRWSGNVGLGAAAAVGRRHLPVRLELAPHATPAASLSNFNPSVTRAAAGGRLAAAAARLQDRSVPRAGRQRRSATSRSPTSACRSWARRRRRRASAPTGPGAGARGRRRAAAIARPVARARTDNNRARVDVGQSPPLDLVSRRARKSRSGART